LSKRKKRVVDAERDGYRDNNSNSQGNSRWKDKKEDRWKKNVIVSAQTPGQKEYIQAILNNDIVFCTGPAGSGKTTVATGIALQHMLAQNPAYEKMVLIRPMKEACGEKLGFLPGSLDEKTAPYAAPIIDNMKVFIDDRQIKNLFYENKIETIPIAFLRGRSLNNCIIIADEAQGLTPEAMLLLLTRLGKESKLLINGDLDQSDIRGENGLYDAMERLQNIPKIAFVELTSADIVRHPLIATILDRYFEQSNNDRA
jgi:phosphate starvation-inducible PhoH-like protein